MYKNNLLFCIVLIVWLAVAQAAAVRDLIVALVREHQPVSREDIDKLLLDKLPEVLTASQKRTKIHNLLSSQAGKTIRNVGSRSGSQWVLMEPKNKDKQTK